MSRAGATAGLLLQGLEQNSERGLAALTRKPAAHA
jgi:hypothetical protein